MTNLWIFEVPPPMRAWRRMWYQWAMGRPKVNSSKIRGLGAKG